MSIGTFQRSSQNDRVSYVELTLRNEPAARSTSEALSLTEKLVFSSIFKLSERRFQLTPFDSQLASGIDRCSIAGHDRANVSGA